MNRNQSFCVKALRFLTSELLKISRYLASCLHFLCDLVHSTLVDHHRTQCVDLPWPSLNPALPPVFRWCRFAIIVPTSTAKQSREIGSHVSFMSRASATRSASLHWHTNCSRRQAGVHDSKSDVRGARTSWCVSAACVL